MSLTKSDLKKIENLIKVFVEVINARIDRLEENMNHRFDAHEKENANQFAEINMKLDRMRRTENEDVSAVYTDIEKMKLRLKKAGI